MSIFEKHSRTRSAVSLVGLCQLLVATGCARSPSFNVLGSYFPGWIACIVIGMLLTALVRVVLTRTRWEERIPALPLFYFCIALLIACTFWLIAFE